MFSAFQNPTNDFQKHYTEQLKNKLWNCSSDTVWARSLSLEVAIRDEILAFQFHPPLRPGVRWPSFTSWRQPYCHRPEWDCRGRKALDNRRDGRTFVTEKPPATLCVLEQFCIFQRFTFKYLLKVCMPISSQYKCLCTWSQVNTHLKFNIHIPDAPLAVTAGLHRHCKYIYTTVAFYIQIPVLFQSFQSLSPTIWSSECPPNPLNYQVWDTGASCMQKWVWILSCLV